MIHSQPSLPSRVMLSPNVLFQALQDEAILLDLTSEQYIGLDPVATRIWQLLSKHGDTTTVIALLLEEYEVDAQKLEADMAAFVQQLCTAGLATVEPNDMKLGLVEPVYAVATV